jgi:hypothetical protein
MLKNLNNLGKTPKMPMKKHRQLQQKLQDAYEKG